MRNFDCVVVGAGINGLAAAVHLSSRGWKVAVVEKNPVAGGAVRTEEITSPGFRHDLFAMNVSLFAGSAFYRTHKAALDAQGLEFVPVTNTFASVFPDGRWLGVSTDIEQTCALISEISPADATQWRAMAEAFPLEAAFIGGILSTPMPSIALVRLVLGTWRKHGFAWMRSLLSRAFIRAVPCLTTRRASADGYVLQTKMVADVGDHFCGNLSGAHARTA